MPGIAPADVLIVGAGPAGAHTALRLARAGRRVVLLDARSFPRPKPCGEFLSPANLPLLDELGLLEPLYAAGAAQVVSMRIETPGQRARAAYRELGRFAAEPGHGLGIRREVLDLQAVEAAQREPGIEVLLGWRVSEPVVDATGRVVGVRATDPSGARVDLRARFTVGADGLRSRIARGMGWIEERSGSDRYAIVARFRGAEERAEAEVHIVGRDYFAACPIDGGLFTANLVVDGGDVPKGAQALHELFESRLAQAPGLAERLAGATLAEPLAACGPLRFATRRCTGPGVALVGDACGFVDPLTGEGLFFAMEGARLLAAALQRALAEPAREAAELRRYERSRRHDFGPRYALAKLLQRGLRRPGVPERVVRVLGSFPALGDLLLGLTGDYLPVRALASPGVWRSALTARRTAG